MLLNQPNFLISLLVITAAVLITYPLATRMTAALRPLMEDFLDRRDARRQKVDVVVSTSTPLGGMPAKGTPVVLVAGCTYLSEHGVEPGQRGTVLRASRLSSDDNGVVVEWENLPNRSIRMDLHEIGLAQVADRVDGRLDEARVKLNDQLRADDGLLDPDQPTETAHREWLAATYGPIKADEFTPAQRAAIRTEFKSSGVENDG